MKFPRFVYSGLPGSLRYVVRGPVGLGILTGLDKATLDNAIRGAEPMPNGIVTNTRLRDGFRAPSLRQRLAFGTALASVMLGGYGSRAAYAGSCYLPGGPGSYLCTLGANAATDLTQTLTGAPLTVTTSAGFGIDTSTTGGNAFYLIGTGGLTFTDAHSSTITGASRGIAARNFGSGALDITTSGVVTGAGGDGVYARNFNGTTDLTIAAADVAGG
jgi:hypothetical protein